MGYLAKNLGFFCSVLRYGIVLEQLVKITNILLQKRTENYFGKRPIPDFV